MKSEKKRFISNFNCKESRKILFGEFIHLKKCQEATFYPKNHSKTKKKDKIKQLFV